MQALNVKKSNTAVNVSKLRLNGLAYETELQKIKTGINKLNKSDVLDSILSKAGVLELTDKELTSKIAQLGKKSEAAAQ